MNPDAGELLMAALQDIVQIVVEDVEHASDRLIEAVNRGKRALLLAGEPVQRTFRDSEWKRKRVNP